MISRCNALNMMSLQWKNNIVEVIESCQYRDVHCLSISECEDMWIARTSGLWGYLISDMKNYVSFKFFLRVYTLCICVCVWFTSKLQSGLAGMEEETRIWKYSNLELETGWKGAQVIGIYYANRCWIRLRSALGAEQPAYVSMNMN